MKRTLLYISLLIVHLLSTGITCAMVYNGTPHKMTQPNGDTVTVFLHGSDLFIDAESVDHYTLTTDETTGEICYAMLSKDGREYASTGITYNGGETPEAVKMIIEPGLRINKESRDEKIRQTRIKLNKAETEQEGPVLRAAQTLPDTVYGLCILIDFPSTKSSVTREQVEQFLNGDDNPVFGNKSSIKEFFQWISQGKLTYINFVPDQFYTAEKEYSDYAPNTATDYTVDQFYPQIQAAINEWGKAHPDQLNLLSANEYQGIKALNILYAGKCTNKWGTGLWPHQSYVNNSGQVKVNNWRYRGWDIYHSYQISDIGDRLTMGTFVHENGHLICGWPDFYQYEEHEPNNAADYNIGDAFSISSETNPPYPNPWALDQMGWLENQIDITDIKDGRVITLKQGCGYAAVYKGKGENVKEKFYLEIRDKYYLHNRANKETGIFIWHSNDAGDNCHPDKDELLDCRPAKYEHPFWKKDNGPKVFDDESDPDAKWHDGANSGIYLWDFSEGGETMTFRCGRYIETPEFTKTTLQKAIVYKAFHDSITLQGGDAPYSLELYDGDLPEGIELTTSGVLQGIPTQAGEVTFTVKVTDSNGKNAFQEFTLIIQESTPFNSAPYPIPGNFQTEGYDRGGAEVAFHTTRMVDTRKIKDARDDNEYFPMSKISGANFATEYAIEGEWTQYTIDVEKSGWYNMSIQNTTLSDVILSIVLDREVIDTMGIPGLYTEESSWFFTTTKAVSKATTKELRLKKGTHKLQIMGQALPSSLQIDSVSFVLTKEDELTRQTETPSRPIRLTQDGEGAFQLSGASEGDRLYVYNAQSQLWETLNLTSGDIHFGANYPKGIYLVRIVGKDYIQTIKAVKR